MAGCHVISCWVSFNFKRDFSSHSVSYFMEFPVIVKKKGHFLLNPESLWATGWRDALAHMEAKDSCEILCFPHYFPACLILHQITSQYIFHATFTFMPITKQKRFKADFITDRSCHSLFISSAWRSKESFTVFAYKTLYTLQGHSCQKNQWPRKKTNSSPFSQLKLTEET